uniref:Large ribosomal subunit protein bL32m n=1 Tax=Mus spicilegus TaxID=10103 RepID=A0A8C6IBZ4_MUSSI
MLTHQVLQTGLGSIVLFLCSPLQLSSLLPILGGPLPALLQWQLQQSWSGFASPPWAPALAVQSPSIITELAHDTNEHTENSSFLDSIFGMAAPKHRRTIEVNRCRGNPHKLIKMKNNIDICPECGLLKQKHVLCGYCYEKVRQETTKTRQQTGALGGGPFKAPPIETKVLYTGEKPLGRNQGKRTN